MATRIVPGKALSPLEIIGARHAFDAAIAGARGSEIDAYYLPTRALIFRNTSAKNPHRVPRTAIKLGRFAKGFKATDFSDDLDALLAEGLA